MKYTRGKNPNSRNGFKKGRVVTKEECEKMSKRNKEFGIIPPSRKGSIVSQETKEKMSKSHTGFKHTEDAKIKIGNGNRGEKCGSWNGGSSFKEYGLEFNNNLKKQILKRDKFTCLICKNPNKKLLHIHHIDYNKKNNSPENLITLCGSCHMKTNHNRGVWKLFFSCDKRKQYHLTIAQLADRLSIVTLKSIKIYEHKEEYELEAKQIMNDLDILAEEHGIKMHDYGQFIRAAQINGIINLLIWENESFVRKGEGTMTDTDVANRLRLTHALNRIRSQAMNVISNILGERKDLKLDYMDAELTKKFGYDFEGIFNEKI